MTKNTPAGNRIGPDQPEPFAIRMGLMLPARLRWWSLNKAQKCWTYNEGWRQHYVQFMGRRTPWPPFREADTTAFYYELRRLYEQAGWYYTGD